MFFQIFFSLLNNLAHCPAYCQESLKTASQLLIFFSQANTNWEVWGSAGWGEGGFSLCWHKIWNCRERRIENTGSDFPKLNHELDVSTSDHNAHLLEIVAFLFLSCLFKFDTVLRRLHIPPCYLFSKARFPGWLLQLPGEEAMARASFSCQLWMPIPSPPLLTSFPSNSMACADCLNSSWGDRREGCEGVGGRSLVRAPENEAVYGTRPPSRTGRCCQKQLIPSRAADSCL